MVLFSFREKLDTKSQRNSELREVFFTEPATLWQSGIRSVQEKQHGTRIWRRTATSHQVRSLAEKARQTKRAKESAIATTERVGSKTKTYKGIAVERYLTSHFRPYRTDCLGEAAID